MDVWNDENANDERDEEGECRGDLGNSYNEDKINDEKSENEKLRHAPPGLVA